MHHNRLFSAAALALCLALVSGSALAAGIDTKAAPVIKSVNMITRKKIKSGSQTSVTVNASTPGFLDLVILNDTGTIVKTICTNTEIHTSNNVFRFQLLDDNGEILPVGNYKVSATMVSQYGVPTKKAVTGALKVTVPIDAYAPPAEGETPVAVAAVGGGNMLAGLGTVSAGTQTGTSAASVTPPAVTVTNTAVSGLPVGAEGLQIGVGPSDSDPATTSGYWALTAESTDDEIWAAIIAPMTVVNTGTSGAAETESAAIYSSTESGKVRLGTVSGVSQGLHVIKKLSNGWALVEAFRNEDGAFVRGYIKSQTLKTTEPNQHYGLVIDKAAQTLTVFKDGVRVGSCYVSTGLAAVGHLNRETPAGEFITVTRSGTSDYYGLGFAKDTVRINGNYRLCEVPTKKKNGTDYTSLGVVLGAKSTRGNIAVQHEASLDGAINADWIWNLTDAQKRVKVLVLDDKAHNEVPAQN